MGATPGLRPFSGKDFQQDLGAVKQTQLISQPPDAALTTIILRKLWRLSDYIWLSCNFWPKPAHLAPATAG